MQGQKRVKGFFDVYLFLLIVILAGFGVFSVSSATFSINSEIDSNILNNIINSYYGTRQAIFFFASFVVIFFVTYVPNDLIKNNVMLAYYAACIMLFVTFAFNRATGVKAWLDMLWGYTLQPSEFMKLSCILVLAKYLEKNYNPMGTLKSSIQLIFLMIIPWGLTLAQGETGSVLVMLFVFAVMIFFGGVRLRILLGWVTVGIVFVGVLYAVMIVTGSDDYRLVRILSFIDPSLVTSDALYQVNNSKIAIGSGGLMGVGAFSQGTFAQLDYVPEDWTDFIYSSIGESFGFFGCMFVLIVYILIIFRMLYLTTIVYDRFGKMIIIGIMSMLLIHVIENVGMTIGLLPVAGIPLPFLSYGGSNLITNMIGIGLVLNVVRSNNITKATINKDAIFHGRFRN